MLSAWIEDLLWAAVPAPPDYLVLPDRRRWPVALAVLTMVAVLATVTNIGLATRKASLMARASPLIADGVTARPGPGLPARNELVWLTDDGLYRRVRGANIRLAQTSPGSQPRDLSISVDGHVAVWRELRPWAPERVVILHMTTGRRKEYSSAEFGTDPFAAVAMPNGAVVLTSDGVLWRLPLDAGDRPTKSQSMLPASWRTHGSAMRFPGVPPSQSVAAVAGGLMVTGPSEGAAAYGGPAATASSPHESGKRSGPGCHRALADPSKHPPTRAADLHST